MFDNNKTIKRPGETKTKMFTEEVVNSSLEQKEKDASFNPFKLK